ncbi:MAG: hypothetical protein IIZ46_00605 [Clostridia bacterium]|nr:hypothetical protein [Clostridia bacterium]
MSENISTNREYKDRLFKFIFGNPENKEWTLSLYNAINNTSYENSDDIQLTTIQDAVYMNMKNDVSFLINDIMNFYEQQSSYNPNMPMRFLIYAGMVYSKYIETSDNYFEYSSSQQKAPAPQCVCFYNGTANKDDRIILKLSDAFGHNRSDIEVTVAMININYGRNKELMEKCKPLAEYSRFVDKVRIMLKETKDLGSAIGKAIDELTDDSLIKPFLMANKAEVTRMCITEFNEEKFRNQTFEEGLEKGKKEGILEALIGLVKRGLITIGQAASQADMSVSEFEALTGLKA